MSITRERARRIIDEMTQLKNSQESDAVRKQLQLLEEKWEVENKQLNAENDSLRIYLSDLEKQMFALQPLVQSLNNQSRHISESAHADPFTKKVMAEFAERNKKELQEKTQLLESIIHSQAVAKSNLDKNLAIQSKYLTVRKLINYREINKMLLVPFRSETPKDRMLSAEQLFIEAKKKKVDSQFIAMCELGVLRARYEYYISKALKHIHLGKGLLNALKALKTVNEVMKLMFDKYKDDIKAYVNALPPHAQESVNTEDLMKHLQSKHKNDNELNLWNKRFVSSDQLINTLKELAYSSVEFQGNYRQHANNELTEENKVAYLEEAVQIANHGLNLVSQYALPNFVKSEWENSLYSVEEKLPQRMSSSARIAVRLVEAPERILSPTQKQPKTSREIVVSEEKQASMNYASASVPVASESVIEPNRAPGAPGPSRHR